MAIIQTSKGGPSILGEVSDFTLATMNVSAELATMIEESAGTAPMFMHERGVEAKTRRKRWDQKSEFERLMEIQTNGQRNVMNSIGGNGGTI